MHMIYNNEQLSQTTDKPCFTQTPLYIQQMIHLLSSLLEPF